MGLGQIHYIDIVADTGTVGSVIVVAEDGELLAYTDSGLSDKGDEVVGHTIGQLADESRWVGTDRIEVAQHDALDRSTTFDIVEDNLLVHLLGIAIRRGSLLVRSLLGNRQILRLGLTVYGA